MGMTNYLKNALLNASLRNTTYTHVSLWLALHSTQSTVTTPGTELTAGTAVNYGRTLITFGATSTGIITNTSDVSLQVSGTWPAIVSIGIYDSSTGGNMLYFNPIVTKRFVNNQWVKFLAGDIIITLT